MNEYEPTIFWKYDQLSGLDVALNRPIIASWRRKRHHNHSGNGWMLIWSGWGVWCSRLVHYHVYVLLLVTGKLFVVFLFVLAAAEITTTLTTAHATTTTEEETTCEKSESKECPFEPRFQHPLQDLLVLSELLHQFQSGVTHFIVYPTFFWIWKHSVCIVDLFEHFCFFRVSIEVFIRVIPQSKFPIRSENRIWDFKIIPYSAEIFRSNDSDCVSSNVWFLWENKTHSLFLL